MSATRPAGDPDKRFSFADILSTGTQRKGESEVTITNASGATYTFEALEKAVDIVEMLAVSNPINNQGVCTLCFSRWDAPNGHRGVCLWRHAVAWVQQYCQEPYSSAATDTDAEGHGTDNLHPPG